MLDRSPRLSRAAWVAVGVACAATGLLTACDTGDGRQLRPAGPDQTATLVNSTTTSAPPDPAVLGSGLPGEGVGEGGLTFRAPWEDEGVIDPRFTCQGTGTSPALSWSGVPAEATNLALVVTDLSADGFIHWIMVGIDPGLTGLEEGLAPTGAVQGTNSFDAIGWGGPCPPPGTGEHEYLVQLHALDQTLDVAEGFDAKRCSRTSRRPPSARSPWSAGLGLRGRGHVEHDRRPVHDPRTGRNPRPQPDLT